MHEFSRTSQIVEAVLSEAEKQQAVRVIQVELEIGDLTFLGIEQVFQKFIGDGGFFGLQGLSQLEEAVSKI